MGYILFLMQKPNHQEIVNLYKMYNLQPIQKFEKTLTF